MNQNPNPGPRGENFASAHAGPLKELGRYSVPHPLLKAEIEGKLFLKEALGLTGLEVSLNRLPPRAFVPFAHRHRENEELYVFVSGRGEFLVDGEAFEVSEGSAVRVAPGGARCWRNPSETEDLVYLVIQAKAGSLPKGTISDGVQVEGRARWPRR